MSQFFKENVYTDVSFISSPPSCLFLDINKTKNDSLFLCSIYNALKLYFLFK